MTAEGADRTRVLVVDDQAMLRGSFRVLVDSTPDLAVVGEVGTGVAAVAMAAETSPDVVLMDVRMPEMDGIDATRQICRGAAEHGSEPATTRVLILTTFDLDEHVFAALRAGASGFLLKETPPAEVLSAIRVVAGGDGLLAPSVTRRLIARFAAPPQRTRTRGTRLDGLTDRELDVLSLVASGLSNTEIADTLRLGMPTVKTHIGRLLAKLHARDRAQLVIAAYEGGLVDAGASEGRDRTAGKRR